MVRFVRQTSPMEFAVSDQEAPVALREPSEEPPSRWRRLWWWFARTWGYTAFGLVCVGLALVITSTMVRYGMLGYSAPIHVAHHPSLLPFTPWADAWRVPPESFQAGLVYSLVFWIGVTGSWGSKPRPERTAHPVLTTLMMAPWGGFMTTAVVEERGDWFELLFVFFLFGLPLMAIATAWRFRRATGNRERVVKWGVVLVLFVAPQLHNDRATPHVGATLAERDAWAREHMGERYEQVVSDLESELLLMRLMGDQMRIAPMTPENGWLKLRIATPPTMKGWLVVDDGTRAARCYVHVRFEDKGRWYHQQVLCRRAGMELHFTPGATNDFAIEVEITDDGLVRGLEYVSKVAPEAIAAFHEVAARVHGVEDAAPKLEYARVWTSADRIYMRAVSSIATESGRWDCHGHLHFDEDWTMRTDVALEPLGQRYDPPTCTLEEKGETNETSP